MIEEVSFICIKFLFAPHSDPANTDDVWYVTMTRTFILSLYLTFQKQLVCPSL